MTKNELEIKCKILERRLNRINEICNQHDLDAPNAIERIKVNVDPDLITDDIKKLI